ncbi:hypothetical protein GCM10008933_21030 [Paenibacillus motobuensis]|uniref:HTH arsR-type domain-containing protein n=2 Tax=Paenibacillus motobuensis TaxID=295324 RepID=A0ABP3I3X0_9BACL
MKVALNNGEDKVETVNYRGERQYVMNKSVLDITTLSALAEPNRMNIVQLLRDGPLTVGEIADRLGLRQPQASKHLKVLSDSRIVEVRVDANRRIYKLRSEPFQAMDIWLQSFQHIMEERFDNLNYYLHELQNKEKP